MYMPQTYTPEWNHWFYNEMDPTKMYDLVKRSLQALDWLRISEGKEQQRWVLKNSTSLRFLADM